jgi:hypothetical protein
MTLILMVAACLLGHSEVGLWFKKERWKSIAAEDLLSSVRLEEWRCIWERFTRMGKASGILVSRQ